MVRPWTRELTLCGASGGGLLRRPRAGQRVFERCLRLPLRRRRCYSCRALCVARVVDVGLCAGGMVGLILCALPANELCVCQSGAQRAVWWREVLRPCVCVHCQAERSLLVLVACCLSPTAPKCVLSLTRKRAPPLVDLANAWQRARVRPCCTFVHRVVAHRSYRPRG